MNLKTVVAEAVDYNVVWHEPWTGINESGENITVSARICIPVIGAIAMQRQISSKNVEYSKTATVMDHLSNFIESNWAVVVPTNV